MKFKELTTKPQAELKKLLEELQLKLEDVTTKVRLGQEKKTHLLGEVRKDIARILTFLNRKQ